MKRLTALLLAIPCAFLLGRLSVVPIVRVAATTTTRATTRAATTTTAAQSRLVLAGVAFMGGGDYRTDRGVTLAQCIEACRSEARCKGLSVNFGDESTHEYHGRGDCWLKATRDWRVVAYPSTASWDGVTELREHGEPRADAAEVALAVAVPSFPRPTDGGIADAVARVAQRLAEVQRIVPAAAFHIVTGIEGFPSRIGGHDVTVHRVRVDRTASSTQHADQIGRHFAEGLAAAWGEGLTHLLWLEDDSTVSPTGYLPAAAEPTVWSLVHRGGYEYNGVGAEALLFNAAAYTSIRDCLEKRKGGPDWRLQACCGGVRCIGHGPFVTHLGANSSTNRWK